MELLAKDTDVMIGTLEMASETRCNDFDWTTKLILVGEAGQATEPMTIIPFQSLLLTRTGTVTH